MEPLTFYPDLIGQLPTDVSGWMQRLAHIQPSMAVGSLALFDLGVSHCGCDASPTILYISYVHEGF